MLGVRSWPLGHGISPKHGVALARSDLTRRRSAEPCRGAFWELRSFRRGRQGNGLVYAARALEQHMADVFAMRWAQRWHCIQPLFVRQLCTRFVCKRPVRCGSPALLFFREL